MQERIDARNGLESYIFNVRHAVDDQLKGKLSPEDEEVLKKAADVRGC